MRIPIPKQPKLCRIAPAMHSSNANTTAHIGWRNDILQGSFTSNGDRCANLLKPADGSRAGLSENKDSASTMSGYSVDAQNTTNSIALHADFMPAKCLERFKNRCKTNLKRCKHRKHKPNQQFPGMNTAQGATEFVVKSGIKTNAVCAFRLEEKAHE
jgi:hypothetical protein